MQTFRLPRLAAFLLVLTSSYLALAREAVAAGTAENALSGIRRVALPGTPVGLYASAGAGYAITESQSGEGAHHRMAGTLALALVPRQNLEFGFLGQVRYDRHPKDAWGIDSGIISHASLLTRYSRPLAKALRVGGDLTLHFVGADKATNSLSSPALDMRLLLGTERLSNVTIGAFAGYRYDKTGNAGKDASRYRMGDRLALGLSDYNAALFGVGAAISLGAYELIGEVACDLLVGKRAPSAPISPIRIDLGFRRRLTPKVEFEVLSEFGVSQRPDPSPSSPLVPVEPRFGIFFGLRYRAKPTPESGPAIAHATPKPSQSPVQPATAIVAQHELTPPVTASVATGNLSVSVLDQARHPLSDATVSLEVGGDYVPIAFKSDSIFEREAVPAGWHRLKVSADLMNPIERDVEVLPGQAVVLQVTLEAAENAGQIRGIIRAFDGSTLPAHVVVNPGDYQVQAGINGAFSLDLSPGKYQVTIQVQGYQTQERKVSVSNRGVVILNVDLQRVKP